MRARASRVVIAGLSASGKTSLVQSLSGVPGFQMIPEHNDWIGGSKNFPPIPQTVEEKKAKQLFFLDIDLNRERWAQEHSNAAEVIVADADFLSPLAHNYGERWLYPGLDVFGWLVDQYTSALTSGQLVPADLYVYLDVSTEERRQRRAGDIRRRRNDVFFSGSLPDDMRRFYRSVLHPNSDRACLPAIWHENDNTIDVTAEMLVRVLKALQPRVTQEVDRLTHTLRAVVNDPPQSAGVTSRAQS
jgi:deoxyadenosine/deoxycytidine kinase